MGVQFRRPSGNAPTDKKSVDRTALRPKSLSLKDMANAKVGTGGKYREFNLKYKFTPPPNTITTFRFATDGEDEYYAKFFSHECGSGKGYRKFICLSSEDGKTKDPACKKGVPRGLLLSTPIYIFKVQDLDGNIVKTYTPEGSKDTYGLFGWKVWTHSQSVGKSIAAKKLMKGLKGRNWSLARDGADEKTKYDLEGHDPSTFTQKVDKTTLAFFFQYLDSMTKSPEEQADIVKGWKPTEGEGDLAPEESTEEGVEEAEAEGVDFSAMDRNALKKYIFKLDPTAKFNTKQSDDDLREIAIDLSSESNSEIDGKDL